MLKTDCTKSKLEKSQGFTLVEAMIAALVFMVGWAGVFSLVSTSFQTTKRSWDSYVAKQIAEYQYWELYYNIKHGGVDLYDTSTWIPDGNPYWGSLNASNKEVCKVIVGKAEDEDLTTDPPRVFIASGDGSGMTFYPAPSGPTPGFGVCWKRFQPTQIILGPELNAAMNYQIINIEDDNNKANYNMEIEVTWPYPPESSTAPKSFTRQFSMGSVEN